MRCVTGKRGGSNETDLLNRSPPVRGVGHSQFFPVALNLSTSSFCCCSACIPSSSSLFTVIIYLLPKASTVFPPFTVSWEGLMDEVRCVQLGRPWLCNWYSSWFRNRYRLWWHTVEQGQKQQLQPRQLCAEEQELVQEKAERAGSPGLVEQQKKESSKNGTKERERKQDTQERVKREMAIERWRKEEGRETGTKENERKRWMDNGKVAGNLKYESSWTGLWGGRTVVVAYAQRRSQLVARNQYERMGSDVTMQCGSLDNEASVSWKVNGTDVKAQHRLAGPRLILTEVDLGHNGLYSCFQNPNGERRDTILLHIGIPPREPTVTCRSNTYPRGFYCSWHQLHSTYIPTAFEVDVQHNQRSLEVQKDSVHKNRCHVRFPEVFSSFPYYVNVTAVNALGKAFTIISFEESSIVKPDPPERVTATPIRDNPRRLEVTWYSPSTWPDIDSFPLKYFLRYRPLIREQWQHVELSDSTFHTITDAYAGKEYIIQVAAKDTEIGTWSDWTLPQLRWTLFPRLGPPPYPPPKPHKRLNLQWAELPGSSHLSHLCCWECCCCLCEVNVLILKGNEK
ncbi:hypothetical protein Q8A73_019922 [Channa argus]|nr:hypothetical protein Q8A73_019922 [Channa argus]